MKDTAPSRVRMEASSACQLRCPSCPTGTKSLGDVIGTGFMKADDFEVFLDRNPSIRRVELSNWGEILLNPEFSEILRIAHERKVALTADNGVNLNTASEEVLEALVRYRFKRMTLSIDGADQEAYSTYRVRGDFDQVLANVDTIIRLRREHRTIYPLLTWKFIIFGHNQHQIAKAREMALERGMVFYPDVNWDASYSPTSDAEQAKEQVKEDARMEVTTVEEVQEASGSRFTKNWCLQLWNDPQINWDGKILGCCINTWTDFGNAFSGDDPGEIETDKVRYAKQMLLGERPPRVDIGCTQCSRYHEMQRDKSWVTADEIRRNALAKRVKEFAHVALSSKILQPISARLLTYAASRSNRRL